MVKLSSDVIVALLTDLYAANNSLKPTSGRVVKRKAPSVAVKKVPKRVAPAKLKKEKTVSIAPVPRTESGLTTPAAEAAAATPSKAKKPRKRLAKTAQTQNLEIHTGDDSSELFPFN